MNRPFEQLGKLIGKNKIQPSKPVVSPAPVKSDEQLFLDAMKDVKEIKEFRAISVRPKNRTHRPALKKHANEYLKTLKVLEEIVRGKRQIRLADTQEYVEWVNPKCSRDTVRKLHEGVFSIRDSLDLHGFTVEEAFFEVGRFISESLKQDIICVKIIHGRGLRSQHGPVIKSNLCRWLSGKHRRHVAGFVSARRCDGGLGATYVILKK